VEAEVLSQLTSFAPPSSRYALGEMRQRSDENGNRDHQLRQVQAYFGPFEQHQQQKA
jgi:hypothetical protein